MNYLKLKFDLTIILISNHPQKIKNLCHMIKFQEQPKLLLEIRQNIERRDSLFFQDDFQLFENIMSNLDMSYQSLNLHKIHLIKLKQMYVIQILIYLKLAFLYTFQLQNLIIKIYANTLVAIFFIYHIPYMLTLISCKSFWI